MRRWLHRLRSAFHGRPLAARRRPCCPALEPLEDRRLLTGAYLPTNLVSDIAGVGRFTEDHLVNPWGIALSPTGPFWIADNGAGVATLVDRAGQSLPANTPLV